MSKGREYEPIMCNRKLKKLTKITENNLGTAMHHINKFLSKPTKILRGFVPEILGFESIYDECTGSFLGERTIYSEKSYPNYQSYEGQCVYHQFWQEYKAGTGFGSIWNFDDLPRLAIVSKYCNTCVPVTVGDAYKVYGNRLVILHKWDKYVNNTKWLRYSEFIHVSANECMTDEEKIFACARDITYDLESYAYEFNDSYLNDLVSSTIYYFNTRIEEELKDYAYSDKLTILLPLYQEHMLEIEVFIDIVLDRYNDDKYYTIKDISTGKKYNDLYDAMMSILIQYDSSDKDDYDDDYDDDYYTELYSGYYDDYR